MSFLLLIIAALAAFCFARPRRALPVIVVAGFLQDPVRKLLPGQPVGLVLTALVLYVGMAAGMASVGSFRVIGASRIGRRLEGPVLAFLVLVVLQAAHLLWRTDAVVLPAIGVASYVAPFVAGAVGFVVGLREDRLLSFLRFYAYLGLGSAATVLVASEFPNAKVFESVGSDLMVYGETMAVRLASGILRTPEVAAWHAATAACVTLILASEVRTDRRKRMPLIVGGLGLLLAILAILSTGRRKALAEIALFVTLSLLFSRNLKAGNRRMLWGLVLCGGLLSYQLIAGSWSRERSAEVRVLTQRGGSTISEGSPRLSAAWGAVGSSLRNYGLVGMGTGAAAQGAQYFAASLDVRWEGEFGLGRVAAELGLVGLVILAILAARLAAIIRLWTKAIGRGNPARARLAIGLAALIGANGAVWVTATQVFGDPFVYLLLGTLGGSLLGYLEAGTRRTSDGSSVVSVVGALPATTTS